MTKNCKLKIWSNSIFYAPSKMVWLKKALPGWILACVELQFNLINHPKWFHSLPGLFVPLTKWYNAVLSWKNGWFVWIEREVASSPPRAGLNIFCWCLVNLVTRAGAEWSWVTHNEWYNCYFADSLKNSISAAVTHQLGSSRYFWAAHKIRC